MGGKRINWTEEAARLLWVRNLQKVNSKVISEELLNIHGLNIKPQYVIAFACRLRTQEEARFSSIITEIPNAESIPANYKLAPVIELAEQVDMSGVIKSSRSTLDSLMGQYNAKVNDVLRDWEDAIYKEMTKQADRVKNFDLNTLYGHTPLTELARLPEADKAKIIDLLRRGVNGDAIKNIEILIADKDLSKQNIGVILPLYFEDDKASDKSLRSALNDIVVATLVSEPSFRRAKQFKGRFGDLVMYDFNLTSAPNYKLIEQNIVKGLSSEYSGVGVNFLLDYFPLGLVGKSKRG